MADQLVDNNDRPTAGADWITWRIRALRLLQFAADTLVLIGAFALAYQLRFEFDVPAGDVRAAYRQGAYVVALELLALAIAGVRPLIWRYVSMAELHRFGRAVVLSVVPIVAIRILLPDTLHVWRVPLSIIVMNTVLGFGAVLSLRILRRAAYEMSRQRSQAAGGAPPERTPILLIGAGTAGVMAAREIQSDPSSPFEIKGFVDDDLALRGATIQNVRVLGTTEDLPRLAKELGIESVVISIVADQPSSAGLSRRSVKTIRDICNRIPVKVRIVPTVHELLTDKVSVSKIRDIQVEDLLGREPVRLETRSLSRLLEGRTVMVTGAGGSIGSELARQVARIRPAKLLLVERAEPALFTLEQELLASFKDLSIVPVIGDVGDDVRMRSVFSRYRPEVLLHAAAHKHVPLMEANPTEAITNNVLATRRLGELAGEFGVDVFVLISTDKAVRPRSVMGASKRMAEIVVQGLNERFVTSFMAVRFGNVMGSTGSVIPIFREQIRRGGPVTVTHPEMMRYFMTIPEAAQLVLQAAAIGEGGEVFTLDMGEPVNIFALAKETIRLSGLEPYEDIDIKFIGARAGEKMVEELHSPSEEVVATRHPKIRMAAIHPHPEHEVVDVLARLTVLCTQGSDRELRACLNEFLHEADVAIEADSDDETPELISRATIN